MIRTSCDHGGGAPIPFIDLPPTADLLTRSPDVTVRCHRYTATPDPRATWSATSLSLHGLVSAGAVWVQQSRIALATASNRRVLRLIVPSSGPRTAPNHVALDRERTYDFTLRVTPRLFTLTISMDH